MELAGSATAEEMWVGFSTHKVSKTPEETVLLSIVLNSQLLPALHWSQGCCPKGSAQTVSQAVLCKERWEAVMIEQ
jgi:hypothetical protein